MSQPGENAGMSMSPAGYAPDPGPPRRRTLVRGLVVAAVVAAMGAPFGLLWSLLAPDVPLWMTERGPVYAESQPEQVVAADGWFALLGLPFGFLLAIGVWRAAPRMRGVPGLLAVTVGAVGAGLLAWWLGRRVGLAGYQETLAAAGPGALLERPPDLSAAHAGWWPPVGIGVLLVPALAAVVLYTLTAAWSPYPSLHPDQPPPVAASPPSE